MTLTSVTSRGFPPRRERQFPACWRVRASRASFGLLPPFTPAPRDILDIVERVVTRAKRAGVTEDRALASMILRELRAERIKMVPHTFRDGERF